MGLGVWPQPHTRAGDTIGQASQITFEGVEVDDQRRRVDLVKAHADLGGGANSHRVHSATGRERGLRTRRGNATRWNAKTGAKSAAATGSWEERMADAVASPFEHALENQRIGGVQIRVAMLSTLIQVCDGYDINSVAWAVPKLIDTWHLPPQAFTSAFLWSSIGILVGALSAGPIGDRVGRRPLLLASLTIFGLASLASVFSTTV